MAREDVAALVCSSLQQRGIEVVLSGGAVVSVYTENEYESYDLDFIQTGRASISSTLALARSTSRNACSMVSFTVFVSMRCLHRSQETLIDDHAGFPG